MKKDLPVDSLTTSEKEPLKESIHQIKKEGKHVLLAFFDYVFLSIRSKYKKGPLEFFVLFIGGFVVSVLFSAFLLLILFQKIDVSLSVPTYSFGVPSFLSFSQSSSRIEASRMDPVVLLGMIKRGDSSYALIDVRSAKEYELGHIKSAISVPVYGTEFLRADGSIERKGLKDAFKKAVSGKEKVILYGQSQYSTYPEAVIKALGGKNIQVLSVGWNEWRHFKNLWVPEAEWDRIDLKDYVQVRDN